MMDFLRTVASVIADDKKSAENSSADNSSRTIVRKIEEIPSVYYSDKLNEIILSQELYKSAIFLNGDFIVEYADEKSYTCAYELYFQDKNDETYKVAAKSKPLDITRLSAEARKDLETNKSIKFEVPAPSEDVRKNYKLVKR
ncbi:MAG: hypothetical protein J5497_07895 [Selenomonadaceae bacterium]|nr:hypothetical protein [Selenomonadaceae bacterium]